MVVIKVDAKKKSLLEASEKTFNKVKELDSAQDIDAQGRIAAVKTEVLWLTNVASKIMGWRQSSSMPDMIGETVGHLDKFKEARRALVQDQGCYC